MINYFQLKPIHQSFDYFTCVDNNIDQVHGLGERLLEVDVVEGDDGALHLGALQRRLTLHSLFFSNLLVIKLGKIVNNDGNGQGNNQYTTNGACRPDNLTRPSFGADVPVADRAHGDDGPPKSLGDTAEQGLLLVLFRKITQTGENEDAHGQKEHEEAELLVRVLEREAERLEAGRVAGQLEDPEDTHDPKHLDYPPDLLKVGRLFVRRCRRWVAAGRRRQHRLLGAGIADEEHGDEVGEDCEHIDNVHAALDKDPLVGRGGKSQNVF